MNSGGPETTVNDEERSPARIACDDDRGPTLLPMAQLRNLISNVLLCAVTTAFLVHFALIGIYGKQVIQESSLTIYWSEVSFFILCLGFAVFNIVVQCKHWR